MRSSLALAAWPVIALVCACGDNLAAVDAAPPEPDAPIGVTCDPVAQAGCAPGQKCGQLVLSPAPGDVRTACVPDGEVEVGGECQTGEPGAESGYDNCAAGADCTGGICRAICLVAGDTCAGAFSCSTYLDLFKDILEPLIGVCDAVCDPVAQDCPSEGEACYLRVFDEAGEATCVGVPEQSIGREQNDACVGPFPGKCFANGCAGGFHPTELNGETTCQAYCRPVDTYVDDPDGDGEGMLIGSPGGAAPSDCDAMRLGVDGQQCRFFQSMISDVTGGPQAWIPAGYGFCSPTIPYLGDCELRSQEQLWRLFDEAGGGQVGVDAVRAFCDDEANAGRCALFCVSLDTVEALFDSYCAAPPVDPSPLCADEPHGRALARRMAVERLTAIE